MIKVSLRELLWLKPKGQIHSSADLTVNHKLGSSQVSQDFLLNSVLIFGTRTCANVYEQNELLVYRQEKSQRTCAGEQESGKTQRGVLIHGTARSSIPQPVQNPCSSGSGDCAAFTVGIKILWDTQLPNNNYIYF